MPKNLGEIKPSSTLEGNEFAPLILAIISKLSLHQHLDFAINIDEILLIVQKYDNMICIIGNICTICKTQKGY